MKVPVLKCRSCGHKGRVGVEKKKSAAFATATFVAIGLLLGGLCLAGFGVPIYDEGAKTARPIKLHGPYPVQLADGRIGTVQTIAEVQQTIDSGGKQLSSSDVDRIQAKRNDDGSGEENVAIGMIAGGIAMLLIGGGAWQRRDRYLRSVGFCRECNADLGDLDRFVDD